MKGLPQIEFLPYPNFSPLMFRAVRAKADLRELLEINPLDSQIKSRRCNWPGDILNGGPNGSRSPVALGYRNVEYL